jgi:hypothetical protein
MFRSSPWFGLGLGSYAAASPCYHGSEVQTAFAHSDYFQLLAEMGVIGLVAFSAAAAHVIVTAWRHGRSRLTGPTVLEVGTSASLAAFLPHGWVDWNFHVPANAFLFAIVLGLFLGAVSNRSAPTAGGGGARKSPKSGGLLVSGMTILVCLACLVGSGQSMRSEKAIAPLRHALLENMRSKSELSSEERTDLLLKALPSAGEAARLQPWNAEYARLVGLGYLHLSQGKDIVFLGEAEQWLTAAVCRSPLPVSLDSTLAEIRLARGFHGGAGQGRGRPQGRPD